MTKTESLHRRIDALLEENLLSRVIGPIIFRGRRIVTGADVDEVVRQAGIDYAQSQAEQEGKID